MKAKKIKYYLDIDITHYERKYSLEAVDLARKYNPLCTPAQLGKFITGMSTNNRKTIEQMLEKLASSEQTHTSKFIANGWTNDKF